MLDNKTALITGAARRIGADIARVLHDQGMTVILHYNQSKEEAHALCDTLNAKRQNSAFTIQGDLVHIDTLSTLVDQAVKLGGRLDVLVNNASRFYKTQMGEITEQEWDDLLTSNLKAPLFLSQAALPHLKKTSGCIINIADIHAERPMREYPVYSISKAGLVMLTKSLAKELGPEVRVNAISPGETLWPEGDTNQMSDELKEEIISRVALKRKGDPEHIAKAVLYLVRDAEYVTGQVLGVDGGRALFM